MLSRMPRWSSACSYRSGDEPPIADNVVAATAPELEYVGYGVAVTTSSSMVASSIATFATTESCAKATWTVPVPTPAPPTDAMVFAAVSTLKSPTIPSSVNSVRGSDVTSVVRSAKCSSTLMPAFVRRPARAAGPPDATNSTGDTLLETPTIVMLAEIAVGRDTFINACPDASTLEPASTGARQASPPTDTHSTLTSSPAADDPMYGTTAYLPSSMTTESACADVTRSPNSCVNGIRVKSAKTASTTTSALSPSYPRALASATTRSETESNGRKPSPAVSICTETPLIVLASSATTLIGVLSTTSFAEPIAVPPPPTTVTSAFPADTPSIDGPARTCATTTPPPLTTDRPPATMLVTSISNAAPRRPLETNAPEAPVLNDAEARTDDRWYTAPQSSLLNHPCTACKCASRRLTLIGKAGAHTENGIVVVSSPPL